MFETTTINFDVGVRKTIEKTVLLMDAPDLAYIEPASF